MRLEDPWLEGLAAEHDNLRAALRWAVEQGAVDVAARLALALTFFRNQGPYLSEAHRWMTAPLQKPCSHAGSLYLSL